MPIEIPIMILAGGAIALMIHFQNRNK